MNQRNQKNIPYYVVSEPYELYYKKDSTKFPVSTHTHNAAELYLTLTDLPDVLLNDTVSRVQKGSLILIPPFCVHQLYHKKDEIYERYILNLDINWLENALCERQTLTECLKTADKPLILSLSEEQLSVLTAAMDHFMNVTTENSIKRCAESFTLLSVLDTIIYSVKNNLSSETTIVTKSQKTVNDIIAYINNHLEEGITLSDIEAHFFLNRDYLSRLFMKHAHTSIGHYISIQRMAKAQQYLREGMTVMQVSEKMGYSSYAYFFKVFKKNTGISPSQYRSNYHS